jgi:hypothetical protein
MEKLDLKKTLKELYSARSDVVTAVDVPPADFLMIDGKGDPNNDPAYAASLQALYSLAYTMKFGVKKERGTDFTVMPLEGLWWTPDMRDFSADRKQDWLWTMMIRMPDFITQGDVEKARQAAAAKKDLEKLPQVVLAEYDEGAAAQIMHIGPYAEEAENIAKIHAWIRDNGHALYGKHHEIYMSDPNRTAPEKLKTIIRQPYS